MEFDVEKLIEKIKEEMKKVKELRTKYEEAENMLAMYHTYGEMEAYNKVLNIMEEMIKKEYQN